MLNSLSITTEEIKKTPKNTVMVITKSNRLLYIDYCDWVRIKNYRRDHPWEYRGHKILRTETHDIIEGVNSYRTGPIQARNFCKFYSGEEKEHEIAWHDDLAPVLHEFKTHRNSITLVNTKEIFTLPLNVRGEIYLRSSAQRDGINMSPCYLHAGFHGRPTLEFFGDARHVDDYIERRPILAARFEILPAPVPPHRANSRYHSDSPIPVLPKY